MPLELPPATKKPRTIRWDAEPTLPRPSAGWEKVVAIGFATALGAGAVAFATILMVVSPAESEWQARPVAASMATESTGSTTSPEGVATADQPSAPAVKAASPRISADGSAIPLVVSAAAASRGGVTMQRPTVALPKKMAAAAPEPNNQRWARSAVAGTAISRHLTGRSAVGNEAGVKTTARRDADEQQVAALPFSALVAEPMRPAEPSLEDDEQATESAEPSRKLRLSSSANMRARPANGAKVLATISGGTSVSSFGCKGGWCEVSADGKRGFIAARFLGENGKVRRASVSAKKRTPRSTKRAPQRKPAAVAAAPAGPAAKTTLPGVFATEPAASNSGR